MAGQKISEISELTTPALRPNPYQAANLTRKVYVLATPLQAEYCGVYVALRAMSSALASKPSLPDERATFASVTLPDGSSETSIAAVPFTRLARASAVMFEGSGLALKPAGAFGRAQPTAGTFAVATGCGVGVAAAATAPAAFFPPDAVRCGGATLARAFETTGVDVRTGAGVCRGGGVRRAICITRTLASCSSVCECVYGQYQ